MTTKEQEQEQEQIELNRLAIEAMSKTTAESHKEFAEELRKIRESTEEIVKGFEVMGTLKKLLIDTAKVVGALAVLAGSFWAFAKFVIFNADKLPK